jgi:hypothetical protein
MAPFLRLITRSPRLLWSSLALLTIVLNPVCPARAQSLAARQVVQANQEQKLLRGYLRTPIRFQANQGQTDGRVQFLSRGVGYSLFLTPADAVLSLRSPKGSTAKLEMAIAGGNRRAPASGLDRAASRTNYFIGNDPSRWRPDVQDFGKVRYRDIYPGIDLTFYGTQSRLEYDFFVAPGVDPDAIRLKFRGMNGLRLNGQGELELNTAAGEVHIDRPVLYQQNADGTRSAVAGAFVVARNEVRFSVGAYDKGRPLVIDPVVNYATYLGGSGDEDVSSSGASQSYFSGIALGPDGSIYLAGNTSSADFPASNAAFATVEQGGVDVFVTKFNPAGTDVLYSTYLGGSSSDYPTAIAVDGSGNAYISGVTDSGNFPTTPGAIRSTSQVGFSYDDGFVTKLNSTGSGLVYSTFIGGQHGSEVTAIAVDATGNAYVTGLDKKNFPTTAGAFQTTIQGQENAFVAKLAVDGNSFAYATYVGGEKGDVGRGIAIDGSGNAYITGFTTSVQFPVVPASGGIQSAIGSTNGTTDGFVSMLNPTGTALIYSTYLGGSLDDEATAIAVDSAGDAYVVGYTDSTDFPTAAPLQAANAGNQDAFVAKLSPSGTTLLFSTYLGGDNPDSALGIALDQIGDAYVTGYTGSTGFNKGFPLLGSIILTNSGTLTTAAFVTEYNPACTAYIYSSLFGTDESVEGTAIAVDSSGIAYITGGASAGASAPFSTPDAYQPALNGNSDAFVAKLWPLFLSPATLTFPDTMVGTTSAPLTATLSNSGFATLNIASLGILGGNAADFAETTTCGSTLAGQSSCDIHVTFTPLSIAAFASTASVSDDASPYPQIVTLKGNGIAAASAPQAVLTPATVAFGNQSSGTSSAVQVIALSNPGTATLNISKIALTGASASAFGMTSACGATLATGASCNISVMFSPTATGSFSAAVSVTDDASGSPQSATLSGTGTAAAAPQEVVTPTSLTFAALTAGSTSVTQMVTLSNPGTADLALKSAGLTGTNTNVFSLSTTCGSAVAAGASCTFSVAFTPNAAGSFSADITIVPSDSTLPTATVTLAGTGTAAPVPLAVLTPPVVAFESQTTGTMSAAKVVVLSNPGNAVLNITGIALGGVNSSDFTLTSACGTTLAAGSACNLSVTFNPSSAAAFAASISVADDATGSPQTATLTGTGTAPPDFMTASPTPPQVVKAGASATYRINVTSTTGAFNLPVTLSASGLPVGAAATFTPPVVTPGSAGATSSMVIQTSTFSASARAIGGVRLGEPSTSAGFAELGSSGLAMVSLLLLCRIPRLRKRRRLFIALSVAAMLSLGITGCGGGFPGPKPSTYTITVTGSNGSDQHSTTVTLTVQ